MVARGGTGVLDTATAVGDPALGEAVGVKVGTGVAVAVGRAGGVFVAVAVGVNGSNGSEVAASIGTGVGSRAVAVLVGASVGEGFASVEVNGTGERWATGSDLVRQATKATYITSTVTPIQIRFNDPMIGL
jgi:hypothetical protein